MAEVITNKDYPIHNYLMGLQRVPRYILALIVVVIAYPLVLVYGYNSTDFKLMYDLVLVAILAILFALDILWIAFRNRNLHYSLGENTLTLMNGSKQETDIPYTDIKNLFVHQGLEDKFVGTASVVIQYDKHDEAWNTGISGLTKQDAEKLKELIAKRRI